MRDCAVKLMVTEIIKCVHKFVNLKNVSLTVYNGLLLGVHWKLKFLMVLSFN